MYVNWVYVGHVDEAYAKVQSPEHFRFFNNDFGKSFTPSGTLKS